jgi:hypothetical protein
MPTPQPVSFSGVPDVGKDDLLHSWQLRMIRAAKEGAVSFWLKKADGYIPGKMQDGFYRAVEELKASGYHVVKDTVHGAPALRVYWGGKIQTPSESIPTKRIPHLFYGGLFFLILSILPLTSIEPFISKEIDQIIQWILGFLGFSVIFLFAIVCVVDPKQLSSTDEPELNDRR